MPIQQQANALTFLTQFNANSAAKSGLTVTCTVYKITSGTPLVSGASATELGSSGIYYYTLSSGNVDANTLYVAQFHTADTTVDSKDMPSLWVVTTWVGNVDAATSTRLAPTVAARTLDVSATGEAGIDWANVGSPTTAINFTNTTVGIVTLVNTVAAAVTQAVWDKLTSALSTTGSIGKLIVDNLNAAVGSIVSGATAAQVWAYVSRTLTSGGGASAADIWTYGARTLTQTAAQVAAVLAGDDLTLARGDTYDISLTGLGDLTGWTKLEYSVKTDPALPDSDADQHIVLSNPAAPTTDGLVRLNKGATTLAWGSITVDNVLLGNITIHLKADATSALYPRSDYLYDVQAIIAGNVHTLTFGGLVVTANADISRGIS